MRTRASNITLHRVDLFFLIIIFKCNLTASLCALKHLHAKGRTDDLFGDPSYWRFGEELNKVLKDWQPSVLPDGGYQSPARRRHLVAQSRGSRD